MLFLGGVNSGISPSEYKIVVIPHVGTLSGEVDPMTFANR